MRVTLFARAIGMMKTTEETEMDERIMRGLMAIAPPDCAVAEHGPTNDGITDHCGGCGEAVDDRPGWTHCSCGDPDCGDRCPDCVPARHETVALAWGASPDHAGDWEPTFALAAAALAAIGEDVYGEDWAAADEGCSRACSPSRAAEIRAALASVPGVAVYP